MNDEPHAQRRGWLKNDNRVGDFLQAPRCGARTRRQTLCLGPAMTNGRCRLHGGLSTGPVTLKGLERSRRANWKHGFYTVEARCQRAATRALIRECRAMFDALR